MCKPQKITRPAWRVPIGVDTSVSVPANANDSPYMVSSADTLRSGIKGLCARDGNMSLRHSGEKDEGGSFSVQPMDCQ